MRKFKPGYYEIKPDKNRKPTVYGRKSKFHERVTFEGKDYNVTIIQKWYLEDDFEAVQQAIDIWYEVETY